jgi:hypothetical protein
MKPSAPLTRKVPLRPGTKRMKQGRSTGKPTKAQQERFWRIQAVGCIACSTLGVTRAAEIHHLTIGGRHGQKRRGHDFTVGLCSWHHRGVTAYGNPALAAKVYGPSYAAEPRRFREVFGNDDALMALQDELIKQETVQDYAA